MVLFNPQTQLMPHLSCIALALESIRAPSCSVLLTLLALQHVPSSPFQSVRTCLIDGIADCIVVPGTRKDVLTGLTTGFAICTVAQIAQKETVVPDDLWHSLIFRRANHQKRHEGSQQDHRANALPFDSSRCHAARNVGRPSSPSKL